MKRSVTRRELLSLIALAGAGSGVFAASAALGLMPDSRLELARIPQAGDDGAFEGDGSRPLAVVLGAGLSGLAVAYELTKAGHRCVVLEAGGRAGGRILTLRAGDVVEELGNVQVCRFDDEPHLYFNAGAARIPQQHRHVMHYCRELGVELEHFINENKEAYIQDDEVMGGKPLRNREFTTHLRGFMAELMAKNFSEAELNAPFNRTEAEALLGAVRSFGDLDEDDVYKGSSRAGYQSKGYLEHGVQKDIVSLHELLKSRFLDSALNANEGETGPVLFQAVGGMDRLTAGFTDRLPGRVRYNTLVKSVRLNERSVSVAYQSGGESREVEADYCFNCIPTHLMAGIDNNFPAEYREAMGYVRRGEAYKSAFQTKTRFWEDESIYGGITWTAHPIRQIWYPSHGAHKRKGVILSAYDYVGDMGLHRLTQAQRLETAIQQGEKIHPGYRQQVEHGVTVAWHRMNHMLGCAARWQRNPGEGWSAREQRLYRTLQQPAGGRHYIIGDQMSVHSAWQESAILSAHWALKDMVKRL